MNKSEIAKAMAEYEEDQTELSTGSQEFYLHGGYGQPTWIEAGYSFIPEPNAVLVLDLDNPDEIFTFWKNDPDLEEKLAEINETGGHAEQIYGVKPREWKDALEKVSFRV